MGPARRAPSHKIQSYFSSDGNAVLTLIGCRDDVRTDRTDRFRLSEPGHAGVGSIIKSWSELKH